MMSSRSICSTIKYHEFCVWNYLSDVFRYQLKASELGFTNDLVFKITDYFGGRSSNCQVYAIHARKEVLRGADIDLFIFNGISYDHYMIQAKILDHTGRYLDIGVYRSGAQFMKLISAAAAESAFPLYLLFNGLTPNSAKGNAEYGCSIVEAETIKTYRQNQRRKLPSGPHPRIRFDDVQSELIPLHHIFCRDCVTAFKLPPGKFEEQIYTGFPYSKISREFQFEGSLIEAGSGTEKEALLSIEEMHLAATRIIIRDDSFLDN